MRPSSLQLLACLTINGLIFPLLGCAPGSRSHPAPAAASGSRVVGEVALVDEEKHFVLIDLDSNLYVPAPGTALRSISAAGKTAHLKTSPEQKRPFVAADIVDGDPAVGDQVVQMTSEADARAAVLAKVAALPATSVPLLDALGRFASKDVVARRSLPFFDNSAMDGYAVQAKSCRAGGRLRVAGEQPAGPDRGLTLGAAEAIRIFTGAPLPAGADAVIMQEDAVREGDAIVAQCDAEVGEFIRRKGSDLVEGQLIHARGAPLTPQSLALLASQGMAEIEVGRRPRLAIVSTGDELARPGTTPEAGTIFESNAIMLHALALGSRSEVTLVEHCPDDHEQLIGIFRRGLQNDALIVSGGVSVGDHDLVKPALRALGAEIDLWQVALKPGKPFLFGTAGSCCVFGLPGNPVSAFVTFLKFVRPALLKMSGASEEHWGLRTASARLAAEVSNEGDRPHYLRGQLHEGVFRISGRQESHALFGLSRANALLRLAPGDRMAAGATVAVELWD